MDIILELMNGQVLKATLVNPFKPEDNEVDVLIGNTGEKQKFLFPEICCLQMKSYQGWMFLFPEGYAARGGNDIRRENVPCPCFRDTTLSDGIFRSPGPGRYPVSAHLLHHARRQNPLPDTGGR